MLANQGVEETSLSLSRTAPQPPERRQQQRHLTILRVGSLVVDGERELCLMRNISAGGVMVHVYRPMEVGTTLLVEIKNDQAIPGKIVWARDSNIGIAFDEPIDVPSLLANPKFLGNGQRARRPRIEIDRMARLRCGARILYVQVRDISQGGIKVDVTERLEPDGDVVVTLDGFRPLPGIVRWQHAGSCGISFIQPLPLQELVDWLRQGA